jgi:hypothetical protein
LKLWVVPTLRQNTIWLASAEIVDLEWADNASNVCGEARNHIGQVDRSLAKLHAAARAIPSIAAAATGAIERAIREEEQAPQLKEFGLPDRLLEICENLLSSSVCLTADEQILQAANRRIMSGLKPAAPGKREPKDCQIIETYFAICRQLRTAAFDLPCVFLSSNSHDFYGEGPPMRPHEDIARGCSEASLTFAQELSHALSILYPR